MLRYPFQLGMVFVAVALIASAVWQTAEAGGKKSDAEVKVQAKADKPAADGKQTFTLTLDINKGWHIYANPVGNEDLNEARTVVEVKAGGKAVKAKVDYPKGKVHVDKLVGNYSIYEDKITIPVQVERGLGNTAPLEVSVRFQACDAKRCLLPATVKLNVP